MMSNRKIVRESLNAFKNNYKNKEKRIETLLQNPSFSTNKSFAYILKYRFEI